MTYAIVWREGDGPEYTGRLELAAGYAILSGRSPAAHEARRCVSLADVADLHVERRGKARRLVVDERDGRHFEVASLEGPGTLHELAEQLARA